MVSKLSMLIPVLGCLIVQIKDHRSTSSSSAASTNVPAADKNIPFSIHNYNDYLTPSPYVPYPQPKPTEGGSKGTNTGTAVGGTSNEATGSAGQANGSTETQAPKGPKIFTTVLFSTPLSLQEEVVIYANTPDPRPNNRKQSQSSLSRTPVSATLPHPPTPLSAMPPTPSSTGPPTKRQKMLLGEKDVPDFESKAILSTAAPLFLEPATNFEHAQKILEKLSDPLHQGDPPLPKARKRTVAELAADEALAASEQRFMLIMDERLAPSISTTTSGKSASSDTEAGAVAFEPRFERFKTLEAIKATYREKAQREMELKAERETALKVQQQHAQQAANKAKQERLEQDAIRQAQDQKQVAENNARREQEVGKMALQQQQQQPQHQAQQQAQHQAQQQAQHPAAQAQQQGQQQAQQQAPQQAQQAQQRQAQQHAQQPQPQQQPPQPQPQAQRQQTPQQQPQQTPHQQHQHQHPSATQNHVSHNTPTSGVMPTVPQNMVPVSQAHQSPIARDGTPHSHSSPSVGTSMASHPMNVTSSNQGNASSPARPLSAVQHGHSGGGVPMVHQRSQQPPSRRGTPQVAIGTPNVQQATPVNHSTPTSRMGHASPPNSITHTPVLSQNPIAAQHLAGSTAAAAHHRQAALQLHNQQRAYILQQQRQQHQQQLQNSPPNLQMSPDRPQMTNAQIQQLVQQREREYNQSLRNHHQQMNGHAANGSSNMQHPSNSQPHMQQPLPQQRVATGMNNVNVYQQQVYQKYFHMAITQLQQQHGASPIPEEMVVAAKQHATTVANQWYNNTMRKQAQAHAQAQAQVQATRQQMMANIGHMPNGGMNGMGGVQ